METNKQNIAKRFASKGVFPFQMAFTLLVPIRNIFLSPKELIRRVELRDSHSVLEVGPGPGYFSTKVAKALPAGKLVLADIQQEMLDYARRRIEKRGLGGNVEYYLCTGDGFALADESFDRIYLVTVIGEVENKEKYIAEFYRMLRPGGLLSISEQAGDPDKLSVEEVKELAAIGGFEFYNLYGSSRNYTANFIKKALALNTH